MCQLSQTSHKGDEMIRFLSSWLAVLFVAFICCEHANSQEKQNAAGKTMNVLFVGNSYTARHNLANVVKQLAEAGNPGMTFNPTQVIYGGRTLSDHWRLGTQHIVNQHSVTEQEVQETISHLQSLVQAKPKDKYNPSGLKRMRALLKAIENGTVDRFKWDLVVLQSYRDDLKGLESRYVKFAPQFSELAKAQGARVLLYETTPTTQNQFPLQQPYDPAPVMEKSKVMAQLARDCDAMIAPMAFVANQCQAGAPEIALRFKNDAHLNQTMAYLTACTMYSALFGKSPEGIEINSVTDIRYWENDRKTGKDRDGNPIKRVFSDKERLFLQRTAFNALQDFVKEFKPSATAAP